MKGTHNAQSALEWIGTCGCCAVFKGRREVRAGGFPAGARSLKTQQHARPQAPRCAAPRESAVGPPRKEIRLGRPGSVDVLGPMVGSCRIDSSHGLRRAGVRPATTPCHEGPNMGLPRKEVIQPQLPLRLPCYDFTPVTSPTFDGSLPCGLGHRLRVLLTPVV
jgi:hypothetical protein